MSLDGACFSSLAGPQALPPCYILNTATHTVTLPARHPRNQSKTTFLSPITTLPQHTHTHAPLSLATILQKPFWKIFWSELLDAAGRQRQHLSSHRWHNRKIGRVCPGIGWGNFGALDSNEHNFGEPEQANRMVINFSEPKMGL